MEVIHAHNAQEALGKGLLLLKNNGMGQDSRNGWVIRAEGPVATVYSSPLERVVSWPARDANPFFHMYEALWMLAGRNDIAGPARYAKNMLNYSDDGVTQHDAYGHRWFYHFNKNQINVIINQLKQNPLDRQCVLEMWDVTQDLGRKGKAIPCNLMATFQVDPVWNKLDLVVFCRSNDIIWGTYGANAVHFGFLLEYVSLKTNIAAGKYTQVSVNYHAYEKEYEKCLPIINEQYRDYPHRVIMMPVDVDRHISQVLNCADKELYVHRAPDRHFFRCDDEWGEMCHRMMWAHQMHRQGHYDAAFEVLDFAPHCDWTVAGQEWLYRRKKRREAGANE